MDPSGVSRLTNPIDEMLLIPNSKFTNPTIVLSSCTKVSSC